uniref:hypothetical protein n=1 Tax=Escherichia coli TaxID=562 RepID=UPI000BE60283|nr:hypothetical protein [Escherichia coli]
MLPSETMIWQPEFTDKTLSRKPGAVQNDKLQLSVLFKLLHKNTITPGNIYIMVFHVKCIFFYLHGAGWVINDFLGL